MELPQEIECVIAVEITSIIICPVSKKTIQAMSDKIWRLIQKKRAKESGELYQDE